MNTHFSCIIKIPSTGSDIDNIKSYLINRFSNKSIFSEILIHTPSHTNDKYLASESNPFIIIELNSITIENIENNLYSISTDIAELSSAKKPQCQVMLSRSFLPESVNSNDLTLTSYFVEYEGIVNSPADWSSHYIKHHVSLMKELPKIRHLLVYSPVPWDQQEAVETFSSILCNRVSFLNHQQLDEALNSPIRDKMRLDYNSLPAYQGTCTHYPMDTYVLV
ncbi:hypothetical protein EH243_16940 [Amphritea opalescens]|uniref:EthD domain-containing protein n=1 Tax=Amphritea opalescens TaxID=2490544 RepID=A0A430KLZ9_9GAMM|nr:hypothetical protein [Amphritea opalescens]RTE64507.1 hypothetical protein EH243_16940 [Amphritea opalescens]